MGGSGHGLIDEGNGGVNIGFEALAGFLPLLGFLMVSRVRYTHVASALTRRGPFLTLVYLVFGAFLLWLAPIPILFLAFNGFVILGVLRAIFRRRQARIA